VATLRMPDGESPRAAGKVANHDGRKTKENFMFKTGDVVKLKSGGPNMTVERLVQGGANRTRDNILILAKGYKDGDVMCQWFAGEELKSNVFTPDVLEIVTKPPAS